MLHPNQPPIPAPVQLPKQFERKRQRTNNYFAMFSCKAGRVMSFYSEPEFDNWALHELDPRVIAMCEEPLRVSLPGSSKRPPKDYVLDLWVRYADGREEFIEVKPTSQLVEIEGGRRAPANWEQVEAWMENKGAVCRFVTDDEIYSNPVLLANAHKITALAAQGYDLRTDEKLLDAIVHQISEASRLKLFELEQRLLDEDVSRVRAAVGLLIIMGRVSSELDARAFDRESLLELSGE